MPQRVNGIDARAELAARKRVKLHFHGLAGAQARLHPFWQLEIDHHGCHVFDVHQVCAVLDEVADVDDPDTGDAIERRHDAHARQSCLRQ